MALLKMDWLRKSLSFRTRLFFICFMVSITGFIFLGYLCPSKVCAFSSWSTTHSHYPGWSKLSLKHIRVDHMGQPLSFLSHPLNTQVAADNRNKLSFDDMVKEDFEFDIKGPDVMVFLHIQKTGGTTFGRHLVKDLDIEKPCMCRRGRKKCKCIRPDSEDKLWLFSRYSTGWKCGLHADWTELTNCVDNAMDQTERESSKRRYFYISLLREPVARFLSEFRHVQRGATWKTSRHWCGGRVPAAEELPPCYSGEDWRDVTLEEFTSCSSNLAINRQTRMLADLTLVGCYNMSLMSRKERDIIMLASAKDNLRKMAFFGLCEYQKISQYLFEKTFHLHFLQPFVQVNETHSSVTLNEISSEDVRRIRELNDLDVQLYSYAKDLLLQRFQKLKDQDVNFEENFRNLGKRLSHIESLFDSSTRDS